MTLWDLFASAAHRFAGRQGAGTVEASGGKFYPEEIEAAYCRSPFIAEMCVMALALDEEATTERLFAVVVPDMDLLRERRIANAGDLLRFELEGQSIDLPAHKRVLGYEVWFESLPRTATGQLQRDEIERRLKDRHRARRDRAATSHDLSWAADEHAHAAAEVIGRHARGAAIQPDSNLELDLGFDSMDRVELLAELEQRFGVRISEDQAHHILTVGQLIDAVRPADAMPGQVREAMLSCWEVLLHDTPSASDSVAGGLGRPRRLEPLVLFTTLRMIRWIAPRVVASGVEHLPPAPPYIISPNHQSHLDPFFMCSVLPYTVFRQLFLVGAAEYFATPLTAWLARRLNLVPVDPDANLVPAMRAGAFGLTHKKILVLFPEGERSIDGTVKRFKKGAAILSRHLTVPIVPVAIHGVHEIWPRNRPLAWRMLLPWNRHRVHIAFGPPMQVHAGMSYGDGATELRNRVCEMWNAIDRSVKERPEHQDRAGEAAREEEA